MLVLNEKISGSKTDYPAGTEIKIVKVMWQTVIVEMPDGEKETIEKSLLKIVKE